MSATALALAAVAVHPGVWAEDGPGAGEPMRSSSEVTVGGMAISRPAYVGSSDRKTQAVPLLSVRWRNGWFAGVDGVGLRWAAGDDWSVGAKLGFSRGRDEDDSVALRGMGSIDSRATLGGFASYRLRPGLGLNASADYGSGQDRNGAQVSLSLRGGLPIAPQHRLFGSIGVSVANQAQMQSLFGVTQEQSARSGYALYSPSAGFKDANITLGYGYEFTPQVRLQAGLSFRTLLDDAKRSPLATSPKATMGTLGLSYRFN